MALLFVVVDIGSPMKLFNVYLYYTPHSMLCWDATVLPIYLILNLIVGYSVLQAENKGVKYGKIVKALAVFSIPFAFSIHIVTAWLYAGLPTVIISLLLCCRQNSWLVPLPPVHL